MTHESGFGVPAPGARRSARKPSGFTLVELLVALGVLLVLATLTFTMVNVTTKGDRIRAAARQAQSYLEGARDRAIHANAPRGVRLLLDPHNPNTVTSLVFVGDAGTSSEGNLRIETNRRTITPLSGQPWNERMEQGLLSNGAEIFLDGNFYTMRQVSVEDPPGSGTYRTEWQSTRDYAGSGAGPWTLSGNASPPGYVLRFNPAVLPNQEPRLLPSGIVIDLNHSRLPPSWGSAGGYSNRMDVMFSPRGPATGLLASEGNVHLLLADVRDVERGLGPVDRDLDDPPDGLQDDERNLGDKLIVTITTQTGKITTHPVYDDVDDVFRYAETGEEAK